MRILIAVDNSSYSEHVVRQVAEMAKNTWADITLLGIDADSKPGEHGENNGDAWINVLDGYCKLFLNSFQTANSPYGPYSDVYQINHEKKDLVSLEYESLKGRKSFNAHLRYGPVSQMILAESFDVGADLIVLGCDQGRGCEWANDKNTAGKIVKNADCSVFLIKKEKKPKMIVCCLDHDNVTQNSIELINQLANFYQVGLEIIGLTDEDGLRTDVDRRMAQILSYYTSRDIKVWVKLVNGQSLNTFIEQTAEQNLVALWMGKKSFLDRLLPSKGLSKLVDNAESSMLILR